MPWFVGFLVWVSFTSFLSVYPIRGIGVALRYLFLLTTLLAINDLWTYRDLRRVLLIYALLLVPVGFYALWQVYVLGPGHVLYSQVATPQRLTSIYENPNALGVTMGHGLAILVPFALVYAARPLNLRRWLILAVLALGILFLAAGLVVSFSRSSYLYFAVVLITLSLCHRRLRNAVASVGVAALLALALLPVPPWAASALRLSSGTSFRGSLWHAGFRILHDHPWTGIGAGYQVFEAYRAPYLGTEAERSLLTTTSGGAHNVFLTNAAQLGWIGLILTLALFAIFWWRVPGALREYRRGDWSRGAAAAAIVGLTVRGMFESGTTLGSGHLPDVLNFFLFGLVLVLPPAGARGPRLLVPAEQLREGRTGGQILWAALVDRWKSRGFPVICEDEMPVHPRLRNRPLLMAFRQIVVHGGFDRGVVVADQSDGGRLGLLLRRLRLRSGVRIVVVVHHLRNEFRLAFPPYVKLMRWNETAVLRLAHRIVVHTHREEEAVRGRGIPGDRITRIPVGIPRSEIRNQVRALEPDEPLRLLWIGGDFIRKDLPTLLRALSSLPSPRPRLDVVGTPHEAGIADRMRALAVELGVDDAVTFLGPVPDELMEELWLGHDVFVLPSRHEGHGTALDEALIRGMPAVVSGLPVFRERLSPREVRFVPVGDAEALASVLAALRDPEVRSGLAEAGRRRAQEFPTWESTLDAYEEVVRGELALVASWSEPGSAPAPAAMATGRGPVRAKG